MARRRVICTVPLPASVDDVKRVLAVADGMAGAKLELQGQSVALTVAGRRSEPDEEEAGENGQADPKWAEKMHGDVAKLGEAPQA